MSKQGLMAAVAAAAGAQDQDQVTVTAELIKTHFPDVAASLVAEGRTAGLAEGKTAGVTEGATVERERILGIEAIAPAGHEALVAELKKDGKTSPDQAAARILRAEKENRKQHAQAIQDLAKESDGVNPAPSATGGEGGKPGAGLEGEAKWKAEWAAMPAKDRRQYHNRESAYVALKKHDAARAARFAN